MRAARAPERFVPVLPAEEKSSSRRRGRKEMTDTILPRKRRERKAS